MSTSSRQALSRTEMVVVTIIGGLIVGLGIMGVLQARESARQRHCANNLRQLGMGLQSYHQAFGLLPPVAYRSGEETTVQLSHQTSHGEAYSMSSVRSNWAILLLPYLGEEQLAALADHDQPITAASNEAIRTTQLAMMSCPTDRFNSSDNPYLLSIDGADVVQFSRGNYGINGGVGGDPDVPGLASSPVADGMTKILVAGQGGEVERAWGSGIAGFNKSFSVQDFKNGLSNLVAIEELRAGIEPMDSRGVWALGEIGSSATWWHGLFGDSPGPNCERPRSDDILGCNQLHEKYGEAYLVDTGMPCCSYTKTAHQATSRSLHPFGVTTLLLDGATKFIANDVDLNVWHEIHSRDSRGLEIEDDYLNESRPTCAKMAVTDAQTSVVQASLSDVVTNSIDMEFVAIPAGAFVMGLPDEGQNHDTPVTGVPPEAPPHEVRISSSFLIGKYEVTQTQYYTVMDSNPSWHTRNGPGRTAVVGKDESLFPVEQVSWGDANTFCARLSRRPEEQQGGRRYRLPTEAEWEYCCRAGSAMPFRASYDATQADDGFNMGVVPQTAHPINPVGSFAPNAFGLYDMRGNVWEWCWDWYARDYYSHSPRIDPLGPNDGVLKVVRGADWRFTNMGCKYGSYHTEPWRTNPFIGFRVVCELSTGNRQE